jgi:hypothetical protein
MDIDEDVRAPFSWCDQQKLAHAMAMAEKLLDRYPCLAEIWLSSADLIRKRINKDLCHE